MIPAYIKDLQAHAERSAAAQAVFVAKRDAQARSARERLSPLDERLGKLLATIPHEVQREGLSLPALVPLLRGRWRANADAGQLGMAMRRAGFRRERKWRGSDRGFSALWFPTAK